jgi:2'-5' RNA ligase
MKKRYNIALLPTAKNANFIARAKNFYPIAFNYKLGPQAMPHITLCQFYSEDTEVNTLWKKILSTGVPHSISLSLNEYSLFEAIDYNWISLRPDNLDALMQMHCMIAKLIASPLGRVFENFDAHLSLINTREADTKTAVAAVPLAPLEDKFILSLGRSDEIGQYKQVIYKW